MKVHLYIHVNPIHCSIEVRKKLFTRGKVQTEIFSNTFTSSHKHYRSTGGACHGCHLQENTSTNIKVHKHFIQEFKKKSISVGDLLPATLK